MAKFIPGKGCRCAAHSQAECGCIGVRWTNDEEVRWLVACAVAVLNHARKATPERMGGTPDLFYPDVPDNAEARNDPWDYHETVLERLGTQLERAIDGVGVQVLKQVKD